MVLWRSMMMVRLFILQIRTLTEVMNLQLRKRLNVLGNETITISVSAVDDAPTNVSLTLSGEMDHLLLWVKRSPRVGIL